MGKYHSTIGPSTLNIPNASFIDTGHYYTTCRNSTTATCFTDTFDVYVSTGAFNISPTPVNLTVSVFPGVTVPIGNIISFIAHSTNAGTKPIFTWYNNWIPIPGATDSIYSGTAGVDFYNGDNIHVQVNRFPNCKSTKILFAGVINITTDVNTINNNKGYRIYPNPATTTITVETNKTDENVELEIINPLGIRITKLTSTTNKQINLPDNLPNGIYGVKINTLNGCSIQTIVIE
jgi:hypothetical protein